MNPASPPPQRLGSTVQSTGLSGLAFFVQKATACTKHASPDTFAPKRSAAGDCCVGL